MMSCDSRNAPPTRTLEHLFDIDHCVEIPVFDKLGREPSEVNERGVNFLAAKYLKPTRSVASVITCVSVLGVMLGVWVGGEGCSPRAEPVAHLKMYASEGVASGCASRSFPPVCKCAFGQPPAVSVSICVGERTLAIGW